MAFDLTAIRDGVSYRLTAGTPFQLAKADGLFWPEVNRVTLRAPTQDGDVDYGAYLSPRLITLSVHFYATSGSALDGYRNTFYRIFRPARSTGGFDNLGDPRFAAQSPITLKVTRDDGVVRQIGVYATGPIDIALERAHAPGNLHRAVVQLVAPNPTWFGTLTTAQYPNMGTVDPINFNHVYNGDYFGQPVFSLSGSVTAPRLINLTTGGTIRYDNVTLSTALDILTVDTISGVSQVNGSVVVPTGTFDMSQFHFSPAPLAAGGTNNIMVSATGAGTTATMTVSYRNRYVSY